MEVPAGGGLPEHDHWVWQIVLIRRSGSVELSGGEDRHTLLLGSVARIATGERVAVHNTGTRPSSLMVVASPPECAARLASWPTV